MPQANTFSANSMAPDAGTARVFDADPIYFLLLNGVAVSEAAGLAAVPGWLLHQADHRESSVIRSDVPMNCGGVVAPPVPTVGAATGLVCRSSIALRATPLTKSAQSRFAFLLEPREDSKLSLDDFGVMELAVVPEVIGADSELVDEVVHPADRRGGGRTHAILDHDLGKNVAKQTLTTPLPGAAKQRRGCMPGLWVAVVRVRLSKSPSPWGGTRNCRRVPRTSAVCRGYGGIGRCLPCGLLWGLLWGLVGTRGDPWGPVGTYDS